MLTPLKNIETEIAEMQTKLGILMGKRIVALEVESSGIEAAIGAICVKMKLEVAAMRLVIADDLSYRLECTFTNNNQKYTPVPHRGYTNRGCSRNSEAVMAKAEKFDEAFFTQSLGVLKCRSNQYSFDEGGGNTRKTGLGTTIIATIIKIK